jgi:C-terminal processing protease CtpA/Prc
VKKSEADPYAREVTRKGNRIVVSRKLADEARQNERIVLSRVAVKTRLDDKGELRSYELVQIDKGSAVDKMGLKPGDQITRVNSIPVRDLEQKRSVLEKTDQFEVTIFRKAKFTKLYVRIE